MSYKAAIVWVLITYLVGAEVVRDDDYKKAYKKVVDEGLDGVHIGRLNWDNLPDYIKDLSYFKRQILFLGPTGVHNQYLFFGPLRMMCINCSLDVVANVKIQDEGSQWDTVYSLQKLTIDEKVNDFHLGSYFQPEEAPNSTYSQYRIYDHDRLPRSTCDSNSRMLKTYIVHTGMPGDCFLAGHGEFYDNYIDNYHNKSRVLCIVPKYISCVDLNKAAGRKLLSTACNLELDNQHFHGETSVHISVLGTGEITIITDTYVKSELCSHECYYPVGHTKRVSVICPNGIQHTLTVAGSVSEDCPGSSVPYLGWFGLFLCRGSDRPFTFGFMIVWIFFGIILVQLFFVVLLWILALVNWIIGKTVIRRDLELGVCQYCKTPFLSEGNISKHDFCSQGKCPWCGMITTISGLPKHAKSCPKYTSAKHADLKRAMIPSTKLKLFTDWVESAIYYKVGLRSVYVIVFVVLFFVVITPAKGFQPESDSDSSSNLQDFRSRNQPVVEHFNGHPRFPPRTGDEGDRPIKKNQEDEEVIEPGYTEYQQDESTPAEPQLQLSSMLEGTVIARSADSIIIKPPEGTVLQTESPTGNYSKQDFNEKVEKYLGPSDFSATIEGDPLSFMDVVKAEAEMCGTACWHHPDRCDCPDEASYSDRKADLLEELRHLEEHRNYENGEYEHVEDPDHGNRTKLRRSRAFGSKQPTWDGLQQAFWKIDDLRKNKGFSMGLAALEQVITDWGMVTIKDGMYPTYDETNIDVTWTTAKLTGQKVIIKGTVTGKLNIGPLSGMTWTIKNDDSDEKKRLTLFIYEAGQLYQGKTKLVTGSRYLETWFKGVCTGDCQSKCGCESTSCKYKIHDYDRNWGCNPNWCWTAHGGCSCCAVDIKKEAPKWAITKNDMKFIHTQLVICLKLGSDKLHCETTTENKKINFKGVTITVGKPEGEITHLPSEVSTVIVNKSYKTIKVTYPDYIWTSDEVCTSSCQHGTVGDVKANSLVSFFEGITSHRKNGIEMSWVGYESDHTCHAGSWPTCDFHNLYKDIDDRIININRTAEHLSTDFNLKSIAQLDEGIRLVVLPKRNTGTIDFSVQINNMELMRKEVKFESSRFTIKSCTGCFSCSDGFFCEAEVMVKQNGMFTIHIFSKNKLVDVDQSSLMLNATVTSTVRFTIHGLALLNETEVEFCITENSACSSAKLTLREPVKRLLKKETVINVKTNDDMNQDMCTGFGWFACTFNGGKRFFGNMFDWIHYIFQNGALILKIIFPIAVILIASFLIYKIYYILKKKGDKEKYLIGKKLVSSSELKEKLKEMEKTEENTKKSFNWRRPSTWKSALKLSKREIDTIDESDEESGVNEPMISEVEAGRALTETGRVRSVIQLPSA